MRHRLYRLVFCALFLGACARVASAPRSPAPPRAIPPVLRLPEGARPTGYAVSLRMDPAQTVFTGTVDIDVVLATVTPRLWLNAADLRIDGAEVTVGGDTRAVRSVAGDQDFVGFAFEPPLGPGTARLRVRYQGRIYDNEQAGIFRQSDRGQRYVFTQFESFDARRAFPCFDEPGFKTPWRLSLTVPAAHTALSNAPALGEQDAGGGWKTVSFAVTPPLPSYLVAFAVGPFEVVDAGRAGRKSTPLRVITTRGRAGEARQVASEVGPMVNGLEEIIGVPQPYDKLDFLAIPQFGGAMENAGLLTFGANNFLVRPGEDTVSGRRLRVDLVAHELAHQWFGDLVTASWWDDIWLNEAFANWMGPKAVDRWKPEWGSQISRVEDRAGAIGSDSLSSARQVRQPILSKDDIGDAFDEITYEKGRAVLEMFESWLGPEAFRRGVKDYLGRFGHGNATSSQFLAAISGQAGRDVRPAFSSFLDQPGVPLVTVDLACPQGGPPRVTVSQARHLPIGSAGQRGSRWEIPVCLRYGDDQESHRRCLLLAQPRTELSLDDAGHCPGWLLGNDGMTGYYVARTPLALQRVLLDPQVARLSPAERVGVLRDMLSLINGGELSAGEALGLLPDLLRDPRTPPRVVAATVWLVARLDPHLIPDALRPSFARLVRSLYGGRAHALGWKPRPGETEDEKLLRAALLPVVSDLGEDRALRDEGERLVRAWLDDRRAVPAELVDAGLQVAAPRGDRAFFDRITAEARKPTTERRDRQRMLRALGRFDDPDLVRAGFALFLSGEFETIQKMGLLFRRRQMPGPTAVLYGLVKEHYDEVVARLPRNGDLLTASQLPAVADGGCDESFRADVEGFFKPRLEHGARPLQQVLEAISLCAAFKRGQQDSVAAFLRSL